ncbi:MAG: RNA polymerase sigma factor [Brevinematales bacterium]|nr:RNA polymerase sigma factor [Brevinematales bacterium]
MKDELTETLALEKPRLLGYIRKRMNRLIQDIEPEDVLQEVSLNLFSKLDLLAPIRNIAGYIYRSVNNYIIDLHRKRGMSAELEDYDGGEEEDWFGDPMGDVYQAYESQVIWNALFQAIATLPAEQRDIWIATELEGKEFHEVAESSGTPIGTLLARKNRANKKLRKLMAEYYE